MQINVNDFLAISIVAVLMSLMIEMIKIKFGSSSLGTKFITVFLAIVLGGCYVWVRNTPYFETLITVLGVASTFYAFFLKKPAEVTII